MKSHFIVFSFMALVLVSGCSQQQNSPAVESQEETTVDLIENVAPTASTTKTYVTPDETFSLEYPKTWSVNENENKAAVTIESAVELAGRLQITFLAGDSDFGMGARVFDKKELINPAGIAMTLHFMEADPDFPGNSEANMNNITINVVSDLFPKGRMTFNYDKSVNPDSEEDMMLILNSLKSA